MPAALRILDPADGTTVGELATAGPAEVTEALTTARKAAADWGRRDPAERGAALRAAGARVAEAVDELALLTTREMGRPLADARGGVEAGAATLLQYAELGPLHRGKSLRGSIEATDLAVPEPLGVVAAITPWNDPVPVACGLVGAALATGNAVILKPSERTPHTGLELARLLAAELPPGVLQVLTGDSTVGTALAASPKVDLVAHVGSTTAGRKVAEAAARTGARVLLENGGKDPLIVDADVDPEWAARQAASGAFANAGQICTSVERIYVLDEVAEPFLRALTRLAAEMRTGPGTDPDVKLGPLVDRRARDTVHAQVSAAVAAGARALTGGEVPTGPGAFYPATVLADCTEAMEVMREETFGPVAPVRVVGSFAEALEAAADSRYGLAATVLTASMAHAQQAWRRLPVGTVKINAVFGGAPGGSAEPRGASGVGVGYGPELLDEMTTTKVVHIRSPG